MLWRPFGLGMRRYVEIFFRNHHCGGLISIFGGQIWAGTKTVTMRLTKKAGVNLSTLKGRRQWGPVVSPHFMFGPRLLHTSNIVFKKFRHSCGFWPPLLRNPGDVPATLPLHIYWVHQWPRVTWKMDSGVLFHTLYVTITNSQRQKKRMLIVIHFNPSRSFFYRDLLSAS